MTSRWIVPGRIEVFGKHTDYAGGRSLVCAAPRALTIDAAATDDGRVRVLDVALAREAEFSICGDGPSDGWCRYPKTVIGRLARNFPGADFSARLQVSSTLPQAAGISSSSAFVIGLAEALIDRAGIESDARWRGVIVSREDRVGYFGCIESGATFRTLAGDNGVGTHGGSEDHAAIVLSTTGTLRAFSFAPIALDAVVPMPDGWTFVVVSSGVAARKAGNVQDAYNTLSLETAAIVAAWRAEHPGDDRTLGQLARDGAMRGWHPPARLRSRLEHFLAEDGRVAEASAAFGRQDVSAIGTLAADSHADADRLLHNQIDETRTLVALAGSLGAQAASSFGAGWGGSVWALVRTSDADAFLSEWLTAYRQYYPAHASEGFVSPPSGGLRQAGTGIPAFSTSRDT